MIIIIPLLDFKLHIYIVLKLMEKIYCNTHCMSNLFIKFYLVALRTTT